MASLLAPDVSPGKERRRNLSLVTPLSRISFRIVVSTGPLELSSRNPSSYLRCIQSPLAGVRERPTTSRLDGDTRTSAQARTRKRGLCGLVIGRPVGSALSPGCTAFHTDPLHRCRPRTVACAEPTTGADGRSEPSVSKRSFFGPHPTRADGGESHGRLVLGLVAIK